MVAAAAAGGPEMAVAAGLATVEGAEVWGMEGVAAAMALGEAEALACARQQ